MTWKLVGQETPPMRKQLLIAEKTKIGWMYSVAVLYICDEGGAMYWEGPEVADNLWPACASDLWMEIPEVPK